MKSLCKLSPKKALLTRIIVWAVVISAVCWVAHIVDKPIQEKKALATVPQLGTTVSRIWLGQTTQVDRINQTAKAIIAARDLKPGDPLPPEEVQIALLRKNPENPEQTQFLDSKKEIHLKTWQMITNNIVATPVASLLSIKNVVPDTGEPYAATAIVGSDTLIENQMRVYPAGDTAAAMIEKTVTETGGLEDYPDPHDPKNLPAKR